MSRWTLAFVLAVLTWSADSLASEFGLALYTDPEQHSTVDRVVVPPSGFATFEISVVTTAIPGGMDYYEFSLQPFILPPGVFNVGQVTTHGNGISCPEFENYFCFSSNDDGSCFAAEDEELIATISYAVLPSAVPSQIEFCLGPPTLLESIPGFMAYVGCGADLSDVEVFPQVGSGCVTIDIVASVPTLESAWGAVKARF